MTQGKAGTQPRRPLQTGGSPFSLKRLADYLGLAPATISLVLNGSAVADTVAPKTKKLIFAAARKFDYRPNFFALFTHPPQPNHWRDGAGGERRV